MLQAAPAGGGEGGVIVEAQTQDYVHGMRGRTVRSRKRERLFLAALGETASVTKAAEVIGITRRTAYDWRESDTAFAEAWDKAVELGTNALEDEMIRRAHHGTDKPVYQGGELVGHIREYSDTLMIFALKARRPGKYREDRNFKGEITVTLANLIEESMRRGDNAKVIEHASNGTAHTSNGAAEIVAAVIESVESEEENE